MLHTLLFSMGKYYKMALSLLILSQSVRAVVFLAELLLYLLHHPCRRWSWSVEQPLHFRWWQCQLAQLAATTTGKQIQWETKAVENEVKPWREDKNGQTGKDKSKTQTNIHTRLLNACMRWLIDAKNLMGKSHQHVLVTFYRQIRMILNISNSQWKVEWGAIRPTSTIQVILHKLAEKS